MSRHGPALGSHAVPVLLCIGSHRTQTRNAFKIELSVDAHVFEQELSLGSAREAILLSHCCKSRVRPSTRILLQEAIDLCLFGSIISSTGQMFHLSLLVLHKG